MIIEQFRKVKISKRTKKIIRNWIIPILIAAFIAIIINKFFFFQVTIPSESMDPTLKKGDRVIIVRIFNLEKLKRGDIVVFYSDELKQLLIKRLKGLPGDRIEINQLGEIFVNGHKKTEPYVIYKDYSSSNFIVPKGHYLFLGDNRLNSYDSRKWSNPYINGKNIRGKAEFIIFPFNQIKKL